MGTRNRDVVIGVKARLSNAVADVNEAYDFAGDTYDFYAGLGRDSIDGAGMPHVVPLGWRYHPGLDVIDIGGESGVTNRPAVDHTLTRRVSAAA